MRTVLDSNILLSALISPHGPPHRIYQAWREHRLDLVTCPTQLDEIRRASRYPKFRTILQPHRVGALVNALHALALPDPPLGGHELDDPNDVWMLALAQASGAQWLVTGDRRSGLLARKRIGEARIVTAVTVGSANSWSNGQDRLPIKGRGFQELFPAPSCRLALFPKPGLVPVANSQQSHEVD